ncbi:hypothetical protein CR205_07060 [Alteribacter lacisalsi]|uniref:Aspartyl-phosphate phosphatase Spo0E family protein n=1 Tax=Alteribacter lacisalsi TaxID=2045244 RepID=A0A2W0HBC6_9BACI|nr:hypothetical protein CR205_07060 [Alteribacter lacisalsi]
MTAVHSNTIEEKRKELLHIAQNCGFNAAETLLCSEELDEMIIKFQQQRGVNKPRQEKMAPTW